MRTLKEKLSAWLKIRGKPPLITEDSTLKEIAAHYPRLWSFLEQKYHLRLEQMNEGWSLKTLVNQFDLPTAQIVFMEIQIDAQQSRVKEITAIEAQELIAQNPELAVLDVRENWEHHYGSLPRSQALDRSLLDSILEDWKKDRPILIYCHFGVRSMDASNYFSEEGFDSVYTIRGGIDAWSVQVDPTLPRYSGSYC